ncbi:hypothetical protein SAMN02745136_03130 [Anaerocolumna jejuensis DSM 15929]|uniref:Uncharacterized protein n=1 Tax=Anaerocolumna jejuensis DSM 15929 TaxID=1121322 RepID=A0A1M6UKF5_9FIRM|nr:hypothetical protein [Anaerocolumna jejuensis]SHK69671.1 hypothetical protein SAMN02745136_03130 [Anaerocolumna jejuensis DSM 15929]
MAGMGDESIDLSKLGTALFAFGFVLVIGLTIFTVGKSITNSGADKVTTQLNTVEQSEFEDYDQQTVLGTKVKAAYSNFEGKPFAIVVTTRSMIDNEGTIGQCPELDTTGTPGKDAIRQIYLEGLTAVNSKGNPFVKYWGVNYNAVLKDPNSLKMDNGAFVTQDTFVMDNGSIQYYNQVSNMRKQGTAEFIPTGAKYMSTLIKDSTGSTCGVVFVQTSSN